jgi:AraC family transcriptional regulator
VYFDGSERLPQWLARSRFTSPATFTNDVVVALTRRLMHELDLGRDDLAYLRALGNALIAELQRELLRPTPVDATDATRGGIRIAHDASELMRARLGEPLTVADLALACGVGISSFSASFRRTTGTTPHRYLRQLRIERACELLRTTALSVAEIASAVGFRGQAHFCVAFGRDRGLTPTAYRQAARVARLA